MHDVPVAIPDGPLTTTSEDPVEILLAAARRYNIMHPYGEVRGLDPPTMEDGEPFRNEEERTNWREMIEEWSMPEQLASHLRSRLYIKALVEGAMAIEMLRR